MGSLNYPENAIFYEGINEVIVNTERNAAPMGIIRKNDTLSMIVFRTSHTAEHILKDGWIVIHITHDPILFVKTAFEDLSDESYIHEIYDEIRICRLKECLNWIACKVHVVNITQEKIFVMVYPFHTEITPVLPFPVHRGLNNIIEATVHGTRFIMNRDPKLADLIQYHGSLILRCGGSREKKALSLLYNYVNAIVPGSFE